MAFNSSLLKLAVGGGLTSGGGAVWAYRSSDSAGTVTGTGYFAGMGYGGRNAGAQGMAIGDFVIVAESTTGSSPGRTTVHSVKASTANVSSTVLSSGWAAGYDVTLSSTA